MTDRAAELLLVVETDGPDATRALGRVAGLCCRGGEVLLLDGDLGAGKTCFVQGLAQGLDLAESDGITSPTFVLHVEHFGRLRLDHLDLYRLTDTEQTTALGFDHLWGDPAAVAAVEWPAVLGSMAPVDAARVELAYGEGENRRRLRFFAPPDAPRARAWALALAARWRDGPEGLLDGQGVER